MVTNWFHFDTKVPPTTTTASAITPRTIHTGFIFMLVHSLPVVTSPTPTGSPSTGRSSAKAAETSRTESAPGPTPARPASECTARAGTEPGRPPPTSPPPPPARLDIGPTIHRGEARREEHQQEEYPQEDSCGPTPECDLPAGRSISRWPSLRSFTPLRQDLAG